MKGISEAWATPGIGSCTRAEESPWIPGGAIAHSGGLWRTTDTAVLRAASPVEDVLTDIVLLLEWAPKN